MSKQLSIIDQFNTLDGKTVEVSVLTGMHRQLCKRKVLRPEHKQIKKKLKAAIKAAGKSGRIKLTLSEKVKATSPRKGTGIKNKPPRASEFLEGIPVLNASEIQELGIEPEPMGAVTGNDVYQLITDMIVKAMAKSEFPWRKPWKAINTYGFAASNFMTKKAYRGINAILLNFFAPALRGKEWDIPYFMTFKQIEKRGGKVKKGSTGYIITYFEEIFKYKGKRVTRLEYTEMQRRGEEEELTSFPVLRYYKVFNADDIEGIDWGLKKVDPKSLRKADSIAVAEEIVSHYPKPQPQIINEQANRAFYRGGLSDVINMPAVEQFRTDQEYYGTLFHELIHSTGAKKRLDRLRSGQKGSKNYALEELVAELGASFLNGESGILFHTLNNSAAYLKWWKQELLKFIKDDNRFFMKAAGQAQKAADYILQPDSKGVPKYRRTNSPKKDRKPKKRNSSSKKPVGSKKKDLNATLAGPPDNNGNVIPVAELLNMEFEILPFSGKWADFMQYVPRNVCTAIYGKEGAGKSSFAWKFADYLTQFGPVLYNVVDQGLNAMTVKVITDAKVKNIDKIGTSDAGSLDALEKDMEGYQFVFIDLINNYNITPEAFRDFKRKHNDKSFHLVFETLKDKVGTFKGQGSWMNIVDAKIHLDTFLATNSKRCGNGQFDVWPGCPHREVEPEPQTL